VIRRFVERPAQVEAVQFTGHNDIEIHDFVGIRGVDPDERGPSWIIETQAGDKRANVGDWIVKDADGFLTVLHNHHFYSAYQETT
jgi:hypothetical protein